MNEIATWTTDNISRSFQLAQSAERLLQIIVSWAYENNELLQCLQYTKDPSWKNVSQAFFSQEYAYAIAHKFYISYLNAGSLPTLLRVSHLSKSIAEVLVEIFLKEWKWFDVIDFHEPYFTATLLAWTWQTWFDALKKRKENQLSSIRHGIFLKHDTSSDYQNNYPYDIKKFFVELNRAWFDAMSTYTSTIIPSLENSLVDEIPYDDYLQLYCEACDQPWDEIKKAQEYLIEQFDVASDLWIQNADGTDVHFDISWMTFANSCITANIPWSEIFSAPRREWVNWKIVAKWKFFYSCSGIIKNIVLDDIKDGKICTYYAEEGNEWFKKTIAAFPWSDYIWEIGIGTNPHLQQHMINKLLVEKIWGSFHVALWKAYTYTHYDGKPVNVDNGNRSSMHRDITTLLRWQESHIMLDGKLVQKNGKWLDPRVSVLNEGWWTLPVEQQPEWRKKDYPHGYT